MSVGIQMGNVKGIMVVDKTFDAANVLANVTAEQDVTVAGVNVGDFVFANPQSFNAGLGVVGARAKSANTIALTYSNNTGSAINAASMTIRFLIIRPEATGNTVIAF